MNSPIHPLNPPGTFKKIIKERPVFDEPPQGEATSVCPSCGREFEQLLIADKNRYTQFKKCPICRQKQRRKMKEDAGAAEVMQVTLDYTPHEKQKLFHESTARFRVLACGARFGKDRASTAEGISYFLRCLNEVFDGKRGTDMIPSVYWWIVAPTERIAKQNWKELCRYFPKELVTNVSNSDMILETEGGGVIEIRSGYDPESLVGVGLDIVTITEAARVADLETVWANVEDRLNSPGRGIEGRGGIGIINSSPKGRNYFFTMFKWGQKNSPDYDPMWESWRFTTWDNPMMAVKGEEIHMLRGRPVKYKDLLKKRKGESRYNQDNLAMFMSGEQKCFPGFEENCVEKIPAEWTDRKKQEFIQEWKNPLPHESYLIGYDPASVGDIPAVVVVERFSGKIKAAYDLSAVITADRQWNPQYDKLRDISRRYNHAPVIFSQTGHMSIEEELVKRGVVCITVNEQGQNKANFVGNLEAVVESQCIRVLEDGSDEIDTLIRQFSDYSRIARQKPGSHDIRIEFGNVEEPHDDYVSACYVVFSTLEKPDESYPYIGAMASIKRH